ncbi:MAG: secondary thiamine-phosphate synthase enzyme YjbQ [Desulfobacterales bacterium]|nr:secondary thiamine-phosphate synthase enzyme YjbQ [Desulfobacterales bacterium]
MKRTVNLTTHQTKELQEITPLIREELRKASWKNGILMLFVPHTTAAVTINENADPDVCTDLVYALKHAFPQHPAFHHIEGNSDAHVMTSLTGSSELIIVENGQLVLGTWQGIYLAEYDGPRRRSLHLKFIEG